MSIQPATSQWNELQRAAEVLTKNWILALPTAVASLILGVIVVVGVLSAATAVVLGHAAGGGLGTVAGAGMGLLTAALLLTLGFLILIFAQSMVMDAAEDAWEGKPVNLAQSLSVAVGRLPDLIVAFLISAVIVFVAAALCAVLIGFLAVPAAIYFLMYVLPAVMIGREGGVAAIQTSFRLAAGNVGPTLIAFVGVIGASIVHAIVTSITTHLPIINFIAAFVVGGLVSAYVALVQARFYDILRGTAPAGAAVATAAPAPPDAGPPTIVR